MTFKKENIKSYEQNIWERMIHSTFQQKSTYIPCNLQSFRNILEHVTPISDSLFMLKNSHF